MAKKISEIDEKFWLSKSGSIYEIKGKEYFDSDIKRKLSKINLSEVTSLSLSEYHYYSKIKKDERISLLEKNIFQKLKNAKIDKYYQIKVLNEYIKVKIIGKSYKSNEEFYIKYMRMDNAIHEKPASSITEIVEIEQVDSNISNRYQMRKDSRHIINDKKSIEDGFYIVIDKLSTCDSGSIIRVINGIVIDKDESSKEIDMNDMERDKLDKIEENESNYLLKYKINERMEKHKNKIFNKIKELKIGDECYYKNDYNNIYNVKQKNIRDKGIEFVLQSQNPLNRKEINADAFDIGLIEKFKNTNEASRISSGQTVKKSIEDGIYIITDKLSTCNSGSIIRVKDGIVIDKDDTNKSLNMNDMERDKLDKIEENESNYLLKYKINERMEKHKNKIFNKIKELNIGDECYYKNDSDNIYIVKQKNIDCKEIEFVLQSKNSVNSRDINVNAFDIGLIKNSEIEKFYILTEEQYSHQIGTMISKMGITKSFPEEVVIEDIDDVKLREIDIVEANYLKMFPVNKRMEKMSKDKFKKICDLKIGDKCCVYNKECIVDRKYLLLNELKFDLKSKKSSNKSHVAVDASNIHLNKNIRNIIENLSSIDRISVNKQNNADSDKIGNKSKSGVITKRANNSAVEIYDLISYESIQLKIINPKSTFEIDKVDNDVSKRYIVIRVENKQIFAKLLWKGMINLQICIGCEMLSNMNIGTDGTFNGKKLFDCKNKHGLLIPLNENINICEKENCVKHIELNVNELIEDKDICCLQTVESFPFANTKINDKILLNIKETCCGTCKWLGLINGKECIAIITNEFFNDRYYKANGLISKLNVFENQLKKTLFVQTKYIPSIINCNLINCGVINPCSIGNIIVTNSTKHKKYIVIKTKQNSELVMLLWKGKIGETICLGCELPHDWIYGTTGTFKEKKLFECSDKRGVLIVMSNEIETCESKDHPEHIEFDEYDVINKNNICCIEFSCDENLKDKNLFCSKNKKIKGLCQWMGKVNGRNCVGILYNDNSIFRSFKPLDKIKALQNLIFLSIKGVEILQLHFIQAKIVDFNKIITVECLKSRTETKIDVDCPVTIKMELNDDNTKRYAGVVKWIGTINDEKCVGIDMEDKFQFGMDGEIDANNKFECMKMHGLITLLSNVELYKCDEILYTLENGIVNPDKIIKCDEKRHRDYCKEKININDSVIVNLNNGEIQLIGMLRWCGLMNKSQVFVVELNEDHENGTDGRFWRSQLFQCQDKRAVSVNPKNILKYEPIKFIDDIFVDNKYYFHQIHFITNSDHYKTGKIVEISSTPKLYGEIDGFFIYYDEQLLRIKLDSAQINNFEMFDKVAHIDPDTYYSKIIVKEKAVNEFNQPLQFDKESSAINKSCIKYKAPHPSENFEKNDFVKLNNDLDDRYFIVDNCIKINGFPCLAVTESILGNSLQYLVEKDVCKVDCSEFKLYYYNGVFIDPLSISSLKRSTFCDLSLGNIVKLKISELSLEFEGVITFTGIANNISVCVIKPRISSLQHIIQTFKINGQNKYYTLWNSSDEPLFIVPLNILKRKNTFEISKGISVMNPKLIKNMRGKKIKERIIIFKCNGEKHLSKLKWAGVIDKEYCYGCEIDFSTEFGTNGKFQDKILFDCKDEHGILIPVYTITDCCETDGHRQIIYYESKVIDKNSICCIKPDENIGEKFQIKINDQIKRKELNEYPYCKWMGYVNKIECIGVEYNYPITNGCDGIFCGVKLFDCINKSGALYKLSEFTSKMSVMKSIMGLKIIDPFYITNIENGKEKEKSMIYKCQGQKHLLNIKWRGCVNGDLCIGCELSCAFEYGTNGIFAGQTLFNCADRSGVLIPVSTLNNTCEENYHNAIELYSIGLMVWKNIPNAINPDCICCVEQLKSIKKLPLIRIGSIIKYDRKKYGCCEWIGLINGKESIGAKVQDNYNEGTNGLFKHFMLFKCEQKKGFIFLADNIEHVVLDLDIMKQEILRFYLASSDFDMKYLSMKNLMKMKDKSIIKSIISCSENPIDLVIHHDLIQILINEKEFEIIKLLLRNCTNYNSCDNIFLNLSNIALSNNDDELFDLSVSKCTNKNAILENGETFLTNLFKKNCNENIINKIIDKKIFDTNITNKDNELPLILACERVMVSTVEKIVNKKPLYIKHKDLAMKTVTDAENKLSQLNRSMGDIFKIVRLLSIIPTNNSLECPICFDNDVSLVYQCGHLSCDKCIKELFKCPFCDQEIKSSIKFYLN